MRPSAEWRPRLLDWYRRNRRDLPWRRTLDPYPIWVSEAMLQQTQVATVLPYFDRWMARFPTVEDLARSSEEEVLAIWQGLGYYRRAKLLRQGAQSVVLEGWPDSIEGWLKMPGVGAYTAAAIGSIAQGLPAAVVDGNVERVFARVTANDRTGPELRRQAQVWATESLVADSPGDWNQAVMELGATVCRPIAPLCHDCPIEPFCVARQTWSVDKYPSKVSAPATIRETHTVWVPYFEGRFGVRQIPDGEWWAGLWEFPRIKLADNAESLRDWVGEGWPESLGHVRHQVTHHKICLEAWLVRCEGASKKLVWRPADGLKDVPMPSPQRRVLRLAFRALGMA